MGNVLCCVKRNGFDDDHDAYERVDKPSSDRQRGIRTKSANDTLHSQLPTDLNCNDKYIEDDDVFDLKKDLNSENTVYSEKPMIDGSSSINNDPNLLISPPAFLAVQSPMMGEQYMSAAESTQYDSAEDDDDDDERSVDVSIDAKLKGVSDDNVLLPDDVNIDADAQQPADYLVNCTFVPPPAPSMLFDSEALNSVKTPPLPFKVPLEVDARKKRRVMQDQVVICNGNAKLGTNQSTPARQSVQTGASVFGDDRQISGLPTPLRENLLSPTRKVEELCDAAGRPLTDTPTRKYFDQKRAKTRW